MKVKNLVIIGLLGMAIGFGVSSGTYKILGMSSEKKAKFDELSASDLSTINETLALYDGIGDYDPKDGIVPVVAARDFISDVIDKNPPKGVIDAGEQLDLKLFIMSRLEATKNSNLIETSKNLQSALNYLKAKEEGLTKD